MRRLLPIFCCFVLLAGTLYGSGPARSQPKCIESSLLQLLAGHFGSGAKHVEICHVGSQGLDTTRVPVKAARAHLRRHTRDEWGRCCRRGAEAFQVVAIDYLFDGRYDGLVPLGELRARGDLGLGTFEGLDGTMVMVDGVIFRVREQGAVDVVTDDTINTPFALVTHFAPTLRIELSPSTSCDDLQALVSAAVPAPTQGMYAAKIVGEFAWLDLRNVLAQKEPFPVLDAVLDEVTSFTANNVHGTMVVFKAPQYMWGLTTGAENVPAVRQIAEPFHRHFVAPEFPTGGHVNDCEISSAVMEIDYIDSLHLNVPSSLPE